MRASLISDAIFNNEYNKLYDYQKETVDNAMNNIFNANEQYFGKIVLPTGAGKLVLLNF